MKRPTIRTQTKAWHTKYAAPDCAYAEITFPDGQGALIELRPSLSGEPSIVLYRVDPLDHRARSRAESRKRFLTRTNQAP